MQATSGVKRVRVCEIAGMRKKRDADDGDDNDDNTDGSGDDDTAEADEDAIDVDALQLTPKCYDCPAVLVNGNTRSGSGGFNRWQHRFQDDDDDDDGYRRRYHDDDDD